MKYEILQDFKGSQSGSVTEQFTKGQVVELSDYLAAAVSPGYIRLAKDQALDGNVSGSSNALTNAQIKAALDDKKIAYDPKAKKADLIALLDASTPAIDPANL
jgi:hypothetical protein